MASGEMWNLSAISPTVSPACTVYGKGVAEGSGAGAVTTRPVGGGAVTDGVIVAYGRSTAVAGVSAYCGGCARDHDDQAHRQQEAHGIIIQDGRYNAVTGRDRAG